MKSKSRWAKEKIRQYLGSKLQGKLVRALPGAREKALLEAACNPLSRLNDRQDTEPMPGFEATASKSGATSKAGYSGSEMLLNVSAAENLGDREEAAAAKR